MKLFLVALLTGALLAQGPGKSMIRVISAGEGWSVDGRALERGKWLAGISSVTGRAHADGLILDCAAKGWIAYTSGNDSCRFPVCADKVCNSVQRVDLAGEDPRTTGWLVPMLTSLFRREPRDVVTLGVRSVGVADGLALQDREDTHWAPVLDRMLDGTHCFRLTSLPAGTAKQGRYFIVNWQHSEAASECCQFTMKYRPCLAVPAGREVSLKQCVPSSMRSKTGAQWVSSLSWRARPSATPTLRTPNVTTSRGSRLKRDVNMGTSQPVVRGSSPAKSTRCTELQTLSAQTGKRQESFPLV